MDHARADRASTFHSSFVNGVFVFKNNVSPLWLSLGVLSLLQLAPSDAHAQDAGAPAIDGSVVDAETPTEDAAPLASDATVVDGDAGNAPAASDDASAIAPTPLAEPAEPELIAPITSEQNLQPPVQPLLISPTPAPAPTEAVEVTVVGTKLSRVAGSAHVLRAKDLERFNYDDPLRVVQSVPGVYVRGEDGMGLRPNIGIRGTNPDRSKKVTLLEDGVLVGPAPYTAPAAYYFPIITRMEKLRVVKGPGTVSYGPQTVGGTIDMITRSIPTTTAGGADVAVGQYGYGKAHVYGGTSTEQVGFLIEGVRLQNSGFKELPNNADTGFARNEWMAKGSYVVDPTARYKNELLLKLTYSDEVSNESYLGISAADFRQNPDQRYAASALDRMVNHRTSIVLTHKLEDGKKWSLTTNAYRHDFTRSWRRVKDFSNDSIVDVLNRGSKPALVEVLAGRNDSVTAQNIRIGPNDRDFVSTGVETRFLGEKKTGAFSHRLEAGARYHYDTIRRRHSYTDYAMEGGKLVALTNEVTYEALNEDYTHAVALHALYAGTWRGLTLTPGVRMEVFRSGHDDEMAETKARRTASVVLPAVGAYYAITDELGVLAGVYQGFSPPTPGSNKSEKPEKSFNYEGGLRYTKGPLRLESIGFINDYKNMTRNIGSSSGGDPAAGDELDSLGAARFLGVEVGGQHDVPVGAFKLPILLSYTLTRGAYLGEGETALKQPYERGYTVEYIPEHQLRVGAGAEHARGGANASFTFVSETLEEPAKGSPANHLHMDQQAIVDLSAYALMWKSVQLYANINNLFNQRVVASHLPFGARPNAPRWVMVGLKGSF